MSRLRILYKFIYSNWQFTFRSRRSAENRDKCINVLPPKRNLRSSSSPGLKPLQDVRHGQNGTTYYYLRPRIHTEYSHLCPSVDPLQSYTCISWSWRCIWVHCVLYDRWNFLFQQITAVPNNVAETQKWAWNLPLVTIDGPELPKEAHRRMKR